MTHPACLARVPRVCASQGWYDEHSRLRGGEMPVLQALLKSAPS
jgi:hypothetical protein